MVSHGNPSKDSMVSYVFSIELSLQVWEFAANAGIRVDALPVMRTSC